MVAEALEAAPDGFEGQDPRRARARAARRGRRLGQLVDADPRRRGLLPAVARSGIRFLANRGANGIDGVVSSALGAAIATGLPTWVLIGELALQHDAGGLLAARRAGVPLEIVCINNGGGGIFDFLPVAEHADPAAYEAHIATPSEDVDLAALWPGLREVRTDRRQNVRLHRELVERVAESLVR